ncbi:hypothetical protein FQZ97_816960 [compost metagenome]
MRPALSFSSMSHQVFCEVLSVWLGGSQLETVKTVCADTKPLASRVDVKARETRVREGMRKLLYRQIKWLLNINKNAKEI